MLFNSFEFITFFLPLVVVVFYALRKSKFSSASKYWLTGASLFFYSWWNPKYLPLLCVSIFCNYIFAASIQKYHQKGSKYILSMGVAFNLTLLGYYKYANFFVDNLNNIAGSTLTLETIILPLGISFFTFQQIAFLVDSYRDNETSYSFMDYALFVSFFPQLIAGPIVHHKEMMPQFENIKDSHIDWESIYRGLFLFAVGLFKKVAIADPLAQHANIAFDRLDVLSFADAWCGSICYTMQLYFDFSGYTDMALGIGLLFCVTLPENFRSPYKATSIQDFWRSWHMTLSRWLRDYLYIPLGGNRKGNGRMLCNVFITFLLGGLWHGAGWTYIIWGAMHGFALLVYNLWRTYGRPLPRLVAWGITFLFINAAWVMFRAKTVADSLKVYSGMLGLNGFHSFSNDFNHLFDKLYSRSPTVELKYLVLAVVLTFFFSTSIEKAKKMKLGTLQTAWTTGLLMYAVILISKNSYMAEFIYFQF